MRQAEVAFRKLKRTLTDAPNRQHFDAAKPIVHQMDMSEFPIPRVLNQCNVFGVLRPVIIYSWKCRLAELNSDFYNPELFAFVETLGQCRDLLVGTHYKVSNWCDQKNLQYFQTSKVLS